MPKARKLKSGNWNVEVFVGRKEGKKITKSFTAPTKKEAEYLAALYSMNKKEQTDDTVRTAIENYITNRSAVLSPSTIRSYRTMQRTAFDDINDIKVSEIKSEDIQKFINSLAKEKSPKSVRNIYGLLKSSITALEPDKAIKVRLPEKKPIERHIPTENDIKRLLDTPDHDLRVAILLASIGTLRIGEVCALKYSDIKGDTIHIHATMIPDENNDFIIKDTPKTSASDRYVTFPKSVIKELGTGDGFVVQSNPRALYARYSKRCITLGIESTRFHDLRHYAASAMHAMGIPDRYIQERGGWQSDIFKSVYRNVLEDQRKTFEEQINSKMSASLLESKKF